MTMARAKLLITGAAAVVFSTADAIAGRQDFALFVERIRHDLVWLQIARRFDVLRGIGGDPFTRDAVTEEGHQHLPLDFPGDLPDAPAGAEVFQHLGRHVSEGDHTGTFTKWEEKSKAAAILLPGCVLGIAAVLAVWTDITVALQEAG
jgi:hypothetical protein